MDITSTIIAISSPPGRSARGLIRVSGPECAALLAPHLADVDLSVRGVVSARFCIGERDLPVLLLQMPSPHSYTSEDTVEMQTAGNPLLLAQIIDAVIESGITRGLSVRHANPGEFTYRAWYHGRMSLDRAEGVAALIAAESDVELDAARHAFLGGTNRLITPISTGLAQVLALVEAGIDFADEEDVVAISSGHLRSRLDLMSSKLQSAVESHGGGEPVDGRCRVVLRGPANAGKSTLFNALLGRKRVVTHDAAGTTRDAIVERGCIGGQDVLLVDTPGDDGDIVSAAAEDAQHEADIVLWCDPVARDSTLLGDRVLFVQTKRDLAPSDAGSDVRVCAFDTGDVSRLATVIAAAIQGRRASRGHLSLTHRQQGLAQAARQCMLDAVGIASGDRAESGLTRPAEVAALLRAGLNDLGAITGEIPPDDVLGLVFAGFCVGK